MYYPKIKGPFKRDQKTGKVIWGDWTCPEFETLKDIPWEYTEKIDGMNIRISFDDNGKPTIGGRTKRALLPTELTNSLVEYFQDFDREYIKENLCGCTLFGEGYGPGIQKGDGYGDKQDFVLFDAVTAGGTWFRHDDLQKLALELPVLGSLNVVPQIGSMYSSKPLTLVGAVRCIKDDGCKSAIGQQSIEAEGLVARAPHGIRDYQGNRIICKLKCKDLFGIEGDIL